jgi:teichuronic acid exporter
LLTILATLSTGKYEFAVLLPEHDLDAQRLVHIGSFLSLLIGSIFCLLFSFLIFFFPNVFYLESQYVWVFLIPFGVAIAGVSSSVLYWLHRTEHYKGQVSYHLVFSFFNASLSVLFGYSNLKKGLEYATVLASLSSLMFLLIFVTKWTDRKLSSGLAPLTNYKQLALRYINFPRFHILTQLLTNVTQQITPLLFAFLYPPAMVGLFALSNRVLRTPVIVVSSSVTSVFRNEFLKELNKVAGKPKYLVFQTLKKLAFLAFPVFVLLFMFLPDICGIVFGDEWYEAGVFGRVLCVMVYLDLILTPISQSLFIILESQKSNLVSQFVSVVLSTGGIFMGYFWDKQVMSSLIGFSVGASLSFIFSFFWSLSLLCKHPTCLVK